MPVCKCRYSQVENQQSEDAAERIKYNLNSLQIEIRDEQQERSILHDYYSEAPTYTMKFLDQLTPEAINPEILTYTREYLQTLKDFYSLTFKQAIAGIEEIKQSYTPKEFQELEQRNSNKLLEEFVTNNKSFDYFTEFNGDMIQKRDPIYQDPTHKFVKAHFYAPRKMIAGAFVPTIWVNVMVIWFMTLMLYTLLYFRVLKKLLDFMERLSAKKSA